MMPAEETGASEEGRGASVLTRGGWDFALMVATVALLGALGAQSLAGTAYAWWAQRVTEGWTESAAYASYIGTMNAIAAPLVVALVVVLGLCVPKRLLTRRALLGVSVGLVAAGLVTWALTGNLVSGLAAYLTLACVLQAAVVVMTLRGAPSLRYLSEGRVTKIGSGLLHLGFLLFALVVVALQESPEMLRVFWASALFITGGTVLSFYARPIARRLGA